MKKLNSIDDLLALREQVKSQVRIRVQGERIEEMTTVTVYVGTSGYKAGAKEIFNYFVDTLAAHGIDDVAVFQADSSGLGDFEPLVGVSVPGKDSVLFGKVTKTKVDDIIEKYIQNNEEIDGVLSLSHTDNI